MSPTEVQIAAAEKQLRVARRRYQQAAARRDVNRMFTWGAATRRLIERLEALGDLNDEGRAAFYIARSV